jgi:hypothetical protein
VLLVACRKSAAAWLRLAEGLDSLHKDTAPLIEKYQSLVAKANVAAKAAKDRQRLDWLARHHKKALQHKAELATVKASTGKLHGVYNRLVIGIVARKPGEKPLEF